MRFLLFLIAAPLVFALAGCGETDEREEASEAPTIMLIVRDLKTDLPEEEMSRRYKAQFFKE